jgi:hypothetical protein
MGNSEITQQEQLGYAIKRYALVHNCTITEAADRVVEGWPQPPGADPQSRAQPPGAGFAGVPQLPASNGPWLPEKGS